MAQLPPSVNIPDALLMEDTEKTELDKVLELMLKPENIAHNTELSDNEITAFQILSPLAKKYDLQVLKDTIFQRLVLKVSKDRKGRKEWVKISSRQLMLADQRVGPDGQNPGAGRSGWRRWFGRR